MDGAASSGKILQILSKFEGEKGITSPQLLMHGVTFLWAKNNSCCVILLMRSIILNN